MMKCVILGLVLMPLVAARCRVGDKTYSTGVTWPADVGCSTCTCQGSTVTCAGEKGGPIAQHGTCPEPTKDEEWGKWCIYDDDCTSDEKCCVTEWGENRCVLAVLDVQDKPCGPCVCQDDVWHCEVPACHPPDCSKEDQIVDGCCPVCT